MTNRIDYTQSLASELNNSFQPMPGNSLPPKTSPPALETTRLHSSNAHGGQENNFQPGMNLQRSDLFQHSQNQEQSAQNPMHLPQNVLNIRPSNDPKKIRTLYKTSTPEQRPQNYNHQAHSTHQPNPQQLGQGYTSGTSQRQSEQTLQLETPRNHERSQLLNENQHIKRETSMLNVCCLLILFAIALGIIVFLFYSLFIR